MWYETDKLREQLYSSQRRVEKNQFHNIKLNMTRQDCWRSSWMAEADNEDLLKIIAKHQAELQLTSSWTSANNQIMQKISWRFKLQHQPKSTDQQQVEHHQQIKNQQNIKTKIKIWKTKLKNLTSCKQPEWRHLSRPSSHFQRNSCPESSPLPGKRLKRTESERGGKDRRVGLAPY